MNKLIDEAALQVAKEHAFYNPKDYIRELIEVYERAKLSIKQSDAFPPMGYDKNCPRCNDTSACDAHKYRSKTPDA